jgi:hypothetical protein
MKLGFEESQSSYTSGSQSARVWSEAWVKMWAYCPHCGNAKISAFPNNSPLADFFCTSCSEEFELKSQRGKFGGKVLDGEFKAKCERLAASNNPNLLLMNYDLNSLAVVNLFIVPKHFFVREIIEKRKPLALLPVVQDGPAQKYCSAAFRNPARFTSCRTASFAPKNSSLRNGKRRFSSEMNRRRRAAGCSMS